jgi:hypothetical protein
MYVMGYNNGIYIYHGINVEIYIMGFNLKTSPQNPTIHSLLELEEFSSTT